MQGVKLPTIEELSNPVRAEKFLVSIGMPPGGLEGSSEDIMNALLHARMPEDGATIAKVAADHNKQVGGFKKAFGWFQEYYVNNLLSGPKTWFGLSIESPLLNMVFDGSMRFIGGVVSGKPSQAIQSLKNFRQVFLEASVAFEYMLRTLQTGRATLMPGVELYDGKVGSGAIQSNSENSLVRFLINGPAAGVPLPRGGRLQDVGLGGLVRAPSRMIMTFDEFFRQVNARVGLHEKFSYEVHDELLDEAIKTGELSANPGGGEVRAWRRRNAKAIAKETERRVERMINDGRLRDQHAVLDEAMNNPDIRAIEDDFERAEAVQEYFSREYTDTHHRNVAYTRERATEAVFQGEMGPVGKSIQRFMDDTMPPLRLLIPFFRTPWKIQEKFFGLMPTNIAAEGVSRVKNKIQNNSWAVPEGGNLGVLHRKHLDDIASGDPARIARARGRQAGGLMVVASAWGLAESGSITGGGPTDWRKRQALIDSGWQPYSIKIGDTYVSYMGMDPFAQYLALFADAYYLMEEEDFRGKDDEKYGFITALATVAGRQMYEKPYIQGLANFFKIISPQSNPSTVKRGLENQLRGAIPMSSMQQQLEYATDEYVVEARTIMEGIRARSYMFGDGDIDPRFNALGERTKTRTSETPDWAHYFFNRVLPQRISVESKDALMNELNRLGVPLTSPRTMSNNPLLGGAEIDLSEIPAPESMGLPEGWTVFAAWMETTRELKVNGKTLRDELQTIFENPELQKVSGWEETMSGNPAVETYRAVIKAYQTAALAKVLEQTPDLQAEIHRQLRDNAETIERNMHNSYGPSSSQAAEAKAAVKGINKELHKLIGAGK